MSVEEGRELLLRVASDPELAEVYARVTALADQSKLVRARDILAIAHEVIRRRPTAMAAESSSAA